MEIKECTCDIMTWSEWTNCSSKCGNGTRSRYKKCNKLANENICREQLKFGLAIEKIECYSTEDCKTSNFNNMPQKIWSDWSDWSECSASCGHGFTVRKRVCLINNGSYCDGPPHEINICTSTLGCKNEFLVKVIDNTKKTTITTISSTKNSFTTSTIVNKIFPTTLFTTSTTTNKIVSTTSKINNNNDLVGFSGWSMCNNRCGNGLKTRYRRCYFGELNCFNFLYEQMSCENYDECTNKSKYIFMLYVYLFKKNKIKY
jgi:hypothetical protein